MGDDMDDILNIFFEECDELLPELERGLGELSENETNPETINAIFRAVHSIKGGAASFGLERLVRFAHVYESALDCLRSGKVEPNADTVRIFFLAMDVLSDLVAEAKQTGDTVDDQRIDENLKNLEGIIQQGDGTPPAQVGETAVPEGFTPVAVDLGGFGFDEPSDDASSSVPGDVPARAERLRVVFSPHSELYARGDDARNLLLGLKELLPEDRSDEMEVICRQEALPILGDISVDDAYLTWEVLLPADKDGVSRDDVNMVFEWVSDVCDVTITYEGDDVSEVAPAVSDLASEVQAAAPIAAEASTLPPSEGEQAPAVAQEVKDAAAPANKAPRKREQHASIRVDIGRIGMLMDMVGEMVIGQASLESALGKNGILQDQELLKRLAVIKSLTRDIQGAVMAIRAQSVRNVFQRMQRVVREGSHLAGKDVALILEGEDTEVDRTLIENLTDPLTHMLRNAIDHGIESPKERLAAGKPEQGTIRLTARHRSGRILIEIRDDGGGINHKRVLQTAIKRGIVSPDAHLSEGEINELIFAPGFSTAETVSDLFGPWRWDGCCQTGDS